tara:strand:+ start:507 stop:710 length:204 start_codon:yes stop_codon:yes gene_type:complete
MKRTIRYLGDARNVSGKFTAGDEFTGNEKDLAPQVACGVAEWIEEKEVKAKKAKKAKPIKVKKEEAE